MPMPRIRSFQGRIFLAILAVVLVPTVLGVAAGAFTLRSIGTRSGTLGAWEAVAETGVDLLESVEAAAVSDSSLDAAASRHRQALSESVRLSRLYTFVAERFVSALPVVAVVVGLLLIALAAYTARRISRSFGRPIAELAGWTERIAHGEELPPDREDHSSIEELETLRLALRRMAEQLEEGRRRAVEHARMRSWTDLARRVAHEIKNPLTPMRMAAAALDPGEGDGRADAARILREEIDRLDEMARTFAQYGRLPEGPRSPVDLGELLSSLAEQHASDVVPVEVSGPAPHRVLGHYDALERAFRNLIVNAVDAQPGGGRVDVVLGEEDGWVTVRLEDRGPGIPVDLLDRIWDPDVTTKSRGTGLGLAIVRQTIVHHEGRVRAWNREEGGAAFEVALPWRSPGSSEEGDPSLAPRTAKSAFQGA